MSDFNQVPPGVLALNNMVYFARNKGEQYTKVRSLSRITAMPNPFVLSSKIWLKKSYVVCFSSTSEQVWPMTYKLILRSAVLTEILDLMWYIQM